MHKVYKIIISNRNLYKEVELNSEERSVVLGTTSDCSARLPKGLFFCDIKIRFENNGTNWCASSDDYTYISSDGIIKLTSLELSHGDSFFVKYSNSNQVACKISFVLDFDSEGKDYLREIDIQSISKINIGGAGNCEILLQDELIKNDVIRLEKQGGKCIIYDNGTKYGVYVNGNKIEGKAEVNDFDFFSIVGCSFYYKYGKLYTSRFNTKINNLRYIDLSEQKSNFSYPKFIRNTRLKHVIPDDNISILDPPSLSEKPKNGLLMSLLPALAMVAMVVVLKGAMGGGGSFIIFSVASMSIGIITSILNFVKGRRDYKKEKRNRVEKYTTYIENKKEEIIESRKAEKNILDDIYYSFDREYQMVKDFSGDLFDRSETDEDFLQVRIGIGALPAKREIEYQQKDALEITDELLELPKQISQEFKLINQVPVVCDFVKSNSVGIIGTEKVCYDFMKNIMLDICIRHYHNDVQLFIIIDEENAPLVHWSRLLPHLKNDLLNSRNIICDDDSKNLMFEYLYKELSRRESFKETSPHFVIFVYDEIGMKRHPISKYIEKASDFGFTFVFFEQSKELLPQGCQKVITLSTQKTGTLVDVENCDVATDFSYEPVSDLSAIEISTKIAPVYCEEVSLEGSLRKNITLFELLNIVTVSDLDLAQRWKTSEVYKTMAAPLGVKTKDEVVYLDLHEKYHGPHGLVAGTTGSGKSEILQSYILSAATLFHPYEVGFMIIDFKGGGMVNQFINLPHLVGAITNIDGREIDRSLKSIKAELQKRQRVFAECGVNQINNYIKMFKAGEVKEPIPHLIIIVDEFAELKAEQPEFMKELISAARIGRSLGVHLILATQKPAGQVNDQIWSNSKFKLCLKVQTKEDSNEVLKSPLAAEIKEPGRSYLQVGNNEIFELFQSAYSGAPVSTGEEGPFNEFKVYGVELSGRRRLVYEKKKKKSDDKQGTQLSAIVDYIAEFCEKSHLERLPSICLPPIPEVIEFKDEIEKQDNSDINVCIGMYDNPEMQYQGDAVLNISGENTIIIGSSQYGKTNLLQTIIRGLTTNYSPKEVSIYIMDFGSMFLKNYENLNHVGGVVCPSDDEKLKNLMKLITSEMTRRKEKLVSTGVSSFAAYREAGFTDMPLIVLMIDNLTALKELYFQDDSALITLCREGIAVGLSIIATNSQTSGFGYKYLSNFSNRIGLYCNDSGEYGNLFGSAKMKPYNYPGRCIIELNKSLFECQTYLAFNGEKEIDRVEELRKYISEQNEHFALSRAKTIPLIPACLTTDYIINNYDSVYNNYKMVVGLDYNDVSATTFDLNNIGVLAITGRANSGKSNFVKNIVYNADKNSTAFPVNIAVIDGINRKYESLKNYKSVTEYSILPDQISKIIQDWHQELEKRYKMLMDGQDKEFANLPLLMLIVNNNDAINLMSEDRDLFDKYKLMTSKFKSMKICFIFANIDNAMISYSSPEVLKSLKESRQFMVFEDLDNFKIFDVPMSVSRAYKKAIEIGDGYYIKENDVKKLKTTLFSEKEIEALLLS